jgi:gas vesicle protein
MNRESKLPHFIVGVGVGAVTAFYLAFRMGESTRKYISQRASKGFDSVNEQARKLRENAEKIVEKAKRLVSRSAGDSGPANDEAERQGYEENKRENMGG